jgi:TP901 family phage tail tape measure protein
VAELRVAIDARGAKRGADEFKRATDKMSRGAKDLDRNAVKAGAATKKFGRSVDDVGRRAKSSTRSIKLMAVAIAAAAATRAVVRGMVDFEQQLVAVGKTSNLSGRQLERLGEDIQLVASRTPLAVDGLLKTAAAAGQLGVSGRDNIVAFATTMEKLARVSDIVGEEGAKQVARLIGVTREAISTVPKLGAVITELGNNSKASESEILRIGLEIAKATAIFDVSSGEALAYGAALAEMGIQAELAATTFGKSFRTIDSAVRNGGKEMQALQTITGQTAAQIRTEFGQSAPAAFNTFLRGLARIKREGGDVTAAMASLGLSNERLNKTLPVLALGADKVAEKFAFMGGQLKAGTALNKEFATSADTLGGALSQLGNQWDILIAKMSKGNGVIAGVVKQITGLIGLINIASGAQSKGLTLQSPRELGQTFGKADRGSTERSAIIKLLRTQSRAQGGLDASVLSQLSKSAGLGGFFANEKGKIGNADAQEFLRTVLSEVLRRRDAIDTQAAAKSVPPTASATVPVTAAGPGAAGEQAQSEARRTAKADLDSLIVSQAEMNRMLQIELEKGTEARIVAEGRLAVQKLSVAAGIENSAMAEKSIEQQIRKELRLQDAIEKRRVAEEDAAQKAQDAARETAQLQEQLTSTVVSGFLQMAQSGGSLGDTLKSLSFQLANILVQRGISGAFATSAKGNVFMGGEIQRFDKGGLPDIITSPMARVSAGTLQTFGENTRTGGEEIVLPAKRNASGELGVMTVGGGGGSKVNDNRKQSVTVNFFGSTDPNEEFRQNARSATRQVQDALGGPR